MDEMAEHQLMQSIRFVWGGVINSASKPSGSLAILPPPEFLAALIANESGGNPDAKRFEPRVLSDLWQVVIGRSPAYGSIGRVDLMATIRINAEPEAIDPLSLDALATSHGLTQIMGYESIAFDVDLGALTNPERSLPLTVKMLGQFAQRDGLDVRTNFAELFSCWNTGRPHAPTADPAYIPNGLARLAIYRDVLEEPPRAISA